MKITGILSVSNATSLKYPYELVVKALASLCDAVVVGVDPGFPEDRHCIESWKINNVQVADFRWDRSNRNGGTEIAIQMDNLVRVAQDFDSDWVVVLQADELLHEQDFSMLREFINRAPATTTGFSMERVYFWRDLATVRKDWSAELVRVFRPGAYSFLADGTSKDGMYAGKIKPGNEIALPYKIYHYSRVSKSPESISNRVRNLDTFFHAEADLVSVNNVPAYDFTPRKYDNYSTISSPPQVAGDFCEFIGSHPQGVEGKYSG